MAKSRVEFLLAEVKREVRQTEVLASLVLLLVLAVAFFVGEAVIDRLLLLDRWVRFAAFAGFGAFSLAYLTVPLYLGLKHIRSLYAARLVEERHPELRDSLTTLLQAEHGEAVGAKGLVGPLRQRVEKTIAPLDPRKQADGRLLKWAGIALALAGVSATAGAFAGGKGYFRCIARCVDPFRELLPPTRTVISRVEPGDATVVRGKTVPVSALTQGEAVREAKVYLAQEDGPWLTLSLAQGTDGAWSGVLPAVKGTTRYFILAGDTKSETCTLSPIDPPKVREVRVECRFPEYSGLGVRETAGGDIDALRGTRATVRVTSTCPLGEAFLSMEDGTQVRMSVEGERARGEITVQKNTTYSVKLVTAEGTRNEEPAVYTVIARKDQPPIVRVTRPGRDVEVPADETLALGISATDDCGIEEMSLVYQIKGGRQGRKPIRLGKERRNLVLETGLLPAAMGLKPGDVMLYYIEALDGQRPQPNRGVSSLYLLSVKQPTKSQVAQARKEEKSQEFKDRMTKEEEAKLAKVEKLLKDLKKPDAQKKPGDKAAQNAEKDDERKADELARRSDASKDDMEAEQAERSQRGERQYQTLPQEISKSMVTRTPRHRSEGGS